MGKIQDIFSPGVAYTRIYDSPMYDSHFVRERLQSILTQGLLGSVEDTVCHVERWDKQVWAQQVAAREGPRVYFNINGRSFSRLHGYDEPCFVAMKQSFYLTSSPNIALIFQLNRYIETIAPEPPQRLQKLRSRRFQVNDMYGTRNSGTLMNPEGQISVDSQYGFMLSARIPPRAFQGFVIDRYRINKYDLVSAMQAVVQDDLQKLLPIYSFEGSLVWPKFMSHRQVQNFIALRELSAAA